MRFLGARAADIGRGRDRRARAEILGEALRAFEPRGVGARAEDGDVDLAQSIGEPRDERGFRSEEHTSELQSLMRISYAVFCLKKKKTCNAREYENALGQRNNSIKY